MLERPFRVGAAVGSGMAAQAAERAGADFILALGAGKMRSMGVASPAALLPVYDGAEFTIDFAISELVPRTRLPVYVGLPLFDPRLDSKTLIPRLRDLGISGLTNFPAVFHLGTQADVLERLGLGRSREICFLAAAASAGLETIGYVRSRTDAVKMLKAGIRTLCVNLSLNSNRAQDVESEETLARLNLAVKRTVQNLRKPFSDLTVYLGGGPISGGASLDRLCRSSGVDGFIGGSALDRAPLEKSLINSVASFREIEVLQNRVESLQRRLLRSRMRHHIVSHSDAMNEVLDSAELLLAAGGHIVVGGERGSGQLEVARYLASRIRGDGRRKLWEVLADPDKPLGDRLFGTAANSEQKRQLGSLELCDSNSPVVVEGLQDLDPASQNRLARFLVTGELPSAAEMQVVAPRRSGARLVMTMSTSPEDSGSGVQLAPALLEAMAERWLKLPPLRDRPEDIPNLARDMAGDLGADPSRLTSGLVRTLMRHDWPGNLLELKDVIGWMMGERRSSVTEAELVAYLGKRTASAEPLSLISQRDRIVKALVLNNLNRSRTADFLGVTRKTLYNQIKRYDIVC